MSIYSLQFLYKIYGYKNIGISIYENLNFMLCENFFNIGLSKNPIRNRDSTQNFDKFTMKTFEKV